MNLGMTDNKKKLCVILFMTAILWMVAHGYRYVNMMFTHDSLLMIYQNDYSWQIAIGRILIPVIVFLRGALTIPWLIGILAILWIALTVYLICDLFEVQSMYRIFWVATICVCSPVVTSMNTSYVMDVDLYTLSLLCSVLFVWLCRKRKYVLAVFSIAASLGLYQAYIGVAIGLCMMLCMRQLLLKPEKADTQGMEERAEEAQARQSGFAKYQMYVWMLLSAVIGAVVYFAAWKGCQSIFHVWTSDSYNGLSSVGDYSGTSILGLIGDTYCRVFEYFWNPSHFQSIVFRGQSMSMLWLWLLRLLNVTSMVYVVYRLIMLAIRAKLTVRQWCACAGLVLLFPFGINVVCFISKGMEHLLMMYSFGLVYIAAILLWENPCKGSDRGRKVFAYLSVGVGVVFVWNSITWSNQVYMKLHLSYEAAYSMMTRIVDDIEDAPGYVPGETQVAIEGSFALSPYLHGILDLDEVGIFGMGDTAITYVGEDYAFMNYILNTGMKLMRVDTSDDEVKTTISAMPIYPVSGAIAYVGDVLVVKVSEE